MGVYYKKTHKIAGINFLPRLTLAEYNNLTVKPEHWIRTDSPFDYSKTDVPKLTLAQYEDLAIKPKFWIRTDAPESYTHMSATQVDMTDSVSVFDYLTDLDANQVKYSNGVSVKDKIELIEIKEKTVSITTSDNQYVTPFTKAAIINYDSEITRDSFISASSSLTASYIVMAYPSYIVFACNTTGTYDLKIKYSKGVHIIT